ncbi:hypothetical protein B0T14DRAFT_169696 [Immersiella caudata]|uniref:Uncharacterized protein n=1 Tax=Immersiella caudata TaxID=314043 RepID=A0AA40C325_9PEZI|nr:hypothetical protein B0T14DRAFT_169696 [Immersiella caudata]
MSRRLPAGRGEVPPRNRREGGAPQSRRSFGRRLFPQETAPNLWPGRQCNSKLGTQSRSPIILKSSQRPPAALLVSVATKADLRGAIALCVSPAPIVASTIEGRAISCQISSNIRHCHHAFLFAAAIDQDRETQDCILLIPTTCFSSTWRPTLTEMDLNFRRAIFQPWYYSGPGHAISSHHQVSLLPVCWTPRTLAKKNPPPPAAF